MLACLAVGGLTGPRGWAAEPPPSAEGASAGTASAEAIKFFESEVRPLLAEKCYRCHGPSRQRSGLRVDRRAALLKGGESGPAVIAGKPAESLLLAAVKYESLEMPPDEQLSPRQIAVLEKWIAIGAPWGAAEAPQAAGDSISAADRAYWAFQPVRAVTPPAVRHADWCRNEIDHFIARKIEAAALVPVPAADRRTLIRRVYFDLLGLPPAPEEVAAFVADPAADAYPRLVDRLLDDPRYGQKWARHWLDLVRYAESDGYKQDAYRPNAWRYRDYVIQAFNDDKPYDQFVLEQLAGDELAADNPQALAATGYLRHWIYEYNQRDVRTQWDTILNDVTDVTGDVFLGLGMGCARCHDHKFDPILQRDYYRLRAFFAPLVPRDDVPYLGGEALAEHTAQLARWHAATADLRSRLEALEAPHRERTAQPAIDKFPPDIRPMMRKSAGERGPLEEQLAGLAYRQVDEQLKKLDMAKKLEGEQRESYQQLRDALQQFAHLRPEPPPLVPTVADVGPQAPPTVIPGTDREILPGFLTVLDPGDAEIVPPPSAQSTGRRLALARWIASPDNPLSTRVIVNRVWQYHFGRGLVATPSDFGSLGQPPTHPELLDWLTARFLAEQWRLKPLHRLILNSATYRQASRGAALAGGPKADVYRGRAVRRLDAEQIRDAMLAVSGDLDPRAGGPSADASAPRRTIYTKVLRNSRDPLLASFDAPDSFSSTSQRNVTITPSQSLMLINGDWTLARARSFARRLHADGGDPADAVRRAYHLAYGREPDSEELQRAVTFVSAQRGALRDADAQQTAPAKQPDSPPSGKPGRNSAPAAWVDFCHVLLNSSEFLYVD